MGASVHCPECNVTFNRSWSSMQTKGFGPFKKAVFPVCGDCGTQTMWNPDEYYGETDPDTDESITMGCTMCAGGCGTPLDVDGWTPMGSVFDGESYCQNCYENCDSQGHSDDVGDDGDGSDPDDSDTYAARMDAWL